MPSEGAGLAVVLSGRPPAPINAIVLYPCALEPEHGQRAAERKGPFFPAVPSAVPVGPIRARSGTVFKIRPLVPGGVPRSLDVRRPARISGGRRKRSPSSDRF